MRIVSSRHRCTPPAPPSRPICRPSTLSPPANTCPSRDSRSCAPRARTSRTTSRSIRAWQQRRTQRLFRQRRRRRRDWRCARSDAQGQPAEDHQSPGRGEQDARVDPEEAAAATLPEEKGSDSRGTETRALLLPRRPPISRRPG
ncbi:hypothetical protein PENTCL1PPCAC_4227, partial [Pristionchus entomophagus]